MPKVSVIMNCYNGDEYLRQAIDSVYAQTFRDWELIFLDNASTDQTAAIAANYDRCLKYFRSATLLTLGAARAQAVSQASGEWIAFLDCDDIWKRNKLQVQLDALDNTDYVLCYSGVREVRPDGTLIQEVVPKGKSGWLLEQLLRQFDINMVTPVLRREMLNRFQLNFDANMTASEEYNLFLRVAAKGKILAIPDILGEYRVSPKSLTYRQIARWSAERVYTLNQLKLENPGIEMQHIRAFSEAYARADYYEARYMVSEGRIAEAKSIMSKITKVDGRYRLLLFTLNVPKLWELVHTDIFRRRIIPFFVGLFQYSVAKTRSVIQSEKAH